MFTEVFSHCSSVVVRFERAQALSTVLWEVLFEIEGSGSFENFEIKDSRL